jgi:hypothetical protein
LPRAWSPRRSRRLQLCRALDSLGVWTAREATTSFVNWAPSQATPLHASCWSIQRNP